MNIFHNLFMPPISITNINLDHPMQKFIMMLCTAKAQIYYKHR